MPNVTLATLQATGLSLEVGPLLKVPGATRKQGRPEQDFLDEVLCYAQGHGWLRAHFRPARTAQGWRTAVAGDGKGFVDIVLVRDRVVWAELKSESGSLSKDQKRWRDALLKAKQEWYTWKPVDWPEIKAVLA